MEKETEKEKTKEEKPKEKDKDKRLQGKQRVEREGEERKTRKRRKREEKERSGPGRTGEWLFLILMVIRNFGVVDLASDDVQIGQRKLEETRWVREMVRNSWTEGEDRGKFPEEGGRKNRKKMHKPSKAVRYT